MAVAQSLESEGVEVNPPRLSCISAKSVYSFLAIFILPSSSGMGGMNGTIPLFTHFAQKFEGLFPLTGRK